MTRISNFPLKNREEHSTGCERKENMGELLLAIVVPHEKKASPDINISMCWDMSWQPRSNRKP